VLFAAQVLIMQCLVDPKQSWTSAPKLDLSFQQAFRVLSSPWLWICWGPMIAGLVWLKSFFEKHKLPSVEKGMMVWWLTNIFFFHTHCDLLSGYFQVMPALTEIYAGMTPAHLQPRWADPRLHLDATYFLELLCEVPLACLCLSLYIRRHPGRYFVETFACAVQMAGTVTYYGPPLIRMEATTSWVCFFDRTFGMAWIVIPLIVLRRHYLAAVEKAGAVKKD